MVAWGWKIMEDHLNETGCNCFFSAWVAMTHPSDKGEPGRHNWKAQLEGTQVPIPIRPRTRRSEYG